MTKTAILTALIFSIGLTACGQNPETDNSDYSKHEKQVNDCLDQWFQEKELKWTELESIFLNYFEQGEIVESTSSESEKYQTILKFFERPTRQFPIFKEKKKAVATRYKLGLSQLDAKQKKQLDCLTDNESEFNENSSLHQMKETIKTLQGLPDISPGLVAGTMNSFLTEEDLEKELYQKLITLTFIYDMTMFLKDENE